MMNTTSSNNNNHHTAYLTSSLDEGALANAALDASEELLQSLTAQNAGVFVKTEHRSRDFQLALIELEQAIENGYVQTEKTLQIFTTHQREPSSTARVGGEHEPNRAGVVSLAELSERHRLRRRTLLQHGSLLELLELPSLMDACIRSQDNHLYEEALNIANFANTLARRHGTTNPNHNHHHNNTIVDNVIHQIRARQADLRRHLLERLRGPVSMPECLEVVTAVRRWNAIQLEQQQVVTKINASKDHHGSLVMLEITHERMEYQLQIDFLEHRDVWCFGGGGSSSISTTTGSSDTTLMDRLERYRTRLFEVSTQFQAIFRRANINNSAVGNNNEDKTAANTTTQHVLNLWLARRIETVLGILRREIQVDISSNNNNNHPNGTSSTSATTLLLDAGYVRDVLEASVFFGTSMGRLGANFTATLSPIFGSAMIHIVTQQYWKDGVTQFVETITVCRDAGVASPLVSSNSSAAAASTTTTTTDGTTTWMDSTSSTALPEDQDGQPQPPPKKLLEFPPLARLVNAFLQGLNELRRCLLPDIFPTLRRHCQVHVLDRVEMELRGFERAVNTPGYSGEATAMRTIATQMNTLLTQLVRSYLLGSLEAAFGNTPAAMAHYHIVHAYCHPPKVIDEANHGQNEEMKEQEHQSEGVDTPLSETIESVVADVDDDEESTGQHESEEDDDDDPPVAHPVTTAVDDPGMDDDDDDEALANELLQED
jgi:hypothetical protein